MNITITPDQEAQLAALARRTGREPGELVQEALTLLLDEHSRFLAAVEAGFASLDRGQFVTHEEVGTRIEQIVRSR